MAMPRRACRSRDVQRSRYFDRRTVATTLDSRRCHRRSPSNIKPISASASTERAGTHSIALARGAGGRTADRTDDER
jgi:hypothetical protein